MKKILTYFTFLLFMVTASSCSKNDKQEVVESTEFTITTSVSKENISFGETAEIVLTINRSSTYKGRYFVRYGQQSGNGVGTLFNNGVVMKPGDLYELSSDEVHLNYTAITDNFHRLDFSFYDNQSQQVNVAVVFNQDRQGKDDTDFSAVLQPTPAKIQLNETVPIHFDLKRSKIYPGKYFIRYHQADGSGLGAISYNGATMKNDEPVEIINETILLSYKALTANYHQIEFTIYDEQGHSMEFTVMFNEDKRDGDDYKFTLTIPPLQRTIQENETVGINLKLTPSVVYSGKYYIKYNQIRGNGFGVLTYSGASLTENVPCALSGNEINLTYKSTSENYHQLDITVYDEQSRKVDVTITFNEDKKGILDQGFRITWKPLNLNSGTNSVRIEFQFKKLDQDYIGKYYMQCSRIGGAGDLFLGESPIGTRILNNTPVEIILNSNNTFSLYFWNHSSTVQKFQIEILFYDEYNFQQREFFKFNY